MRVLFVADGRSPIALNWISYFLDRGDEVHLVSTFECAPSEKFASINIVPVAFSQLKKAKPTSFDQSSKGDLLWGSSLVNLRTSLRRILSPLSLPGAAKRLEGIIAEIKPDLVHAMRIPFEGILAAQALHMDEVTPLIISVWGNDFTLHAKATPWMRSYTRLSLARADGLHTDCKRDLRLASQWGYIDHKPSLVVPGNGGIKTDLFYSSQELSISRRKLVINPRGVRSYIRNDTFFAAIPHILDSHPETKFVCPGMIAESEVKKWIEKYDIAKAVELLPNQSRIEMAELFRQAAVAISPSTHDGTPNTLLEAMACGCYPIAGDLDSIREWIEPGVNGNLIDPADRLALAVAVSNAFENPALRQKAAEINQGIIAERAEYQSAMIRAQEFYKTVLEGKIEGGHAPPS
jgi:glycosyltransferase involved in cell wall biosynthesis